MKDWGWLPELFMAGCFVLVLAVVIPLNRRFTRDRRLASGWTQWCRTAAGVPRRDRARLYWANATGRAVADPRLAELAAQRGVAVQGLLRGPVTRASRLGMAGIAAYFAGSGVSRVMPAFPLVGAAQVLAGLALGYVAATMGRGGASAAANRRLVEHGHSPDT